MFNLGNTTCPTTNTTNEFEVEVTTGSHVRTYPVEGFVVRGKHLVPVYDGGTTPYDESPMSEVALRPTTKD